MSKWTSKEECAYSSVFNPQSLLRYYKTILEKVSFDPVLMAKEYQKALRDLGSLEALELRQWMHYRGLTSKLEPRLSQGRRNTLRPTNQEGHTRAAEVT